MVRHPSALVYTVDSQRLAWRSIRALLWLIACTLAAPLFCPAQNITRMWFTPPVVPETHTQSVRFEATVSPAVASCAFNYNGVDRAMFDNGTNGDLVAGDSTWTILFTANEILSKNTAIRVFRPFIGTCRPAGGSAFNAVAECWTSSVGLPSVRAIDATGQETDYVANYVATTAQLLNFDSKVWAQRFYQTHGDHYDFLNFVHVAGARGNRFHFGVKNAVNGIGLSIFNNTAEYGSGGRLQGISVFPISSFFDGAEGGFSHETGHQWINFLSGTSFAAGVPHWPKGNIAINVMGFSIGGAGGVGGMFPYTFTPNGSGGYVVGSNVPINQTTFNTMELYLMGLATPAEVGTFFVLNDQNQNISNGQTLTAAEITTVSVNDVIAAKGARVPASAAAQKHFRCATIVISEALLDPYAMALYSHFAQRCETKTQVTYASGLATGTCNPWFLATGMRSVMFSKIAHEIPVVRVSQATNGDLQLAFSAKHGISYQRQSSGTLSGWLNESAPFTVAATGAPWETPIIVAVPPPVPGVSKFYRFQVLY
jgi:hypothetical protein